MHARIADRLARAGLPLLAQHVDPIDAGTLVDIFRDDPCTSLLGTDALRDGVDVPGDSLRLVVMERVPWPRDGLHARRWLGRQTPMTTGRARGLAGVREATAATGKRPLVICRRPLPSPRVGFPRRAGAASAVDVAIQLVGDGRRDRGADRSEGRALVQ